MTNGFFNDKRVCVTGGAGLVGSYINKKLRQCECAHVAIPLSREFDLLMLGAVQRLYVQARLDMVIHLAATVGRTGANSAQSAEFFYDNLMMGAQLMYEAWSGREKKFIGISLPKVHAGDSVDPQRSHVIAALIKKCTDARRSGASEVTVWGDGSPTRRFLYGDDAAAANLMATEHYDSSESVNIGPGIEVSIRELAETITQLTVLKARTGFKKGLRRAVEWYLAREEMLVTGVNP